MMERFEYDISRHSVEMFTDLAYLCSEDGTCQVGRIPSNGLERIAGILNHRGEMGWELIQVTFGTDGALAFWKRALRSPVVDLGAAPAGGGGMEEGGGQVSEGPLPNSGPQG